MKELHNLIVPPVFPQKNIKRGPFALSVLALLIFVFCVVSAASAAQEYSASEVDSPPKIVRQVPVTYPPQAKKDGITGSVVIRCLVGVNGKADKLEITESNPAGIFNESALSSLKYWQFRPGIKDGELVATWVKIPFKFE